MLVLGFAKSHVINRSHMASIDGITLLLVSTQRKLQRSQVWDFDRSRTRTCATFGILYKF